MLDISLAKELWRLGFRWDEQKSEGDLGLPHLSQLLQELEQHSYFPELSKEEDGRYRCILWRMDPDVGEFYEVWSSESYRDTWENATAECLLWALRRQDPHAREG